MNKITLIILLIIALQQAQGQGLEGLLKETEQNSAELKAIRQQNEAKVLQMRNTNIPANPNFEYGYFPGNTDAIGTKKVYGISQNFEFPTVYRSRKDVIDGNETELNVQYQYARRQVLMQVKKAAISYAYHQKMLHTILERLKWNKALEKDMRRRYEQGDIAKIDLKKASMQVIRLENEVSNIRKLLSNDSLNIVALNSGLVLKTKLQSISFPEIATILNKEIIDKYVNHHPKTYLQIAKVDNARRIVHLRKQEYLPDIKIAYESEQIMSDIHRGIKAGISIPLWGDKHTISSAKKQADAHLTKKNDLESRLKTEAEKLLKSWKSDLKTYRKFKSALDDYSNPALLKSAHKKGYISSIELYMELDYYYGLQDDLLKIKYQVLKTQAELMAFEL